MKNYRNTFRMILYKTFHAKMHTYMYNASVKVLQNICTCIQLQLYYYHLNLRDSNTEIPYKIQSFLAENYV